MNVYSAVEASLTEPERRRLMAAVLESLPHMRGAHVADVLELLYESNARCGEVDALMGALSTGDGHRNHVARICVLASLYSQPEAGVGVLLQRALAWLGLPPWTAR